MSNLHPFSCHSLLSVVASQARTGVFMECYFSLLNGMGLVRKHTEWAPDDPYQAETVDFVRLLE